MSLRSIFKIFLPKGHAWSKDSRTRDGRKGYDTLNDALDTLGRKRCCGFDCCEGVFYVPVDGADHSVKVSVEQTEPGVYQFVFSDALPEE